MEKLSHIDDLKCALDDFAFHQKTSKSTKSINYFATAQYSLGGSGVYREFCFFSIYTGLYLEAVCLFVAMRGQKISLAGSMIW